MPGATSRVVWVLWVSRVVMVFARWCGFRGLAVGHVEGEATGDGDGQQAEDQHRGAEAAGGSGDFVGVGGGRRDGLGWPVGRPGAAVGGVPVIEETTGWQRLGIDTGR